jgi:hypothetical protein
MDEGHFVAKCYFSNKDIKIETCALVDTGATGLAFVNEEFVSQHNLPRYQLRMPRTLEVIDGRTIESGEIREYIRLKLNVGGHEEEISAFITKLGHYSTVLGIPWMRAHGVKLDFKKEELTFGAPECQQHCTNQDVTVTNELRNRIRKSDIAAISAIAYQRSLRNPKRYGKIQAFALSLHDINSGDKKLNPTLRNAYQKPSMNSSRCSKRLWPDNFPHTARPTTPSPLRTKNSNRRLDHCTHYRDLNYKY